MISYYAPLAIAIVLFITVTYIFFPELFRSTPKVYRNPDHRYPTDEMVASARILNAVEATMITNRAGKPIMLLPEAKRELMAMMYMIEKAANAKERSVAPGIDPPYEMAVITTLVEYGFTVKPNGAGTYLISWE